MINLKILKNELINESHLLLFWRVSFPHIPMCKIKDIDFIRLNFDPLSLSLRVRKSCRRLTWTPAGS